jgi:hypothetical protein
LTTLKRWADGPAPRVGLVLLVGLQLWLILSHAPWRDELQAYLLVRDSHGLAGLFANLHYEGHPSLWYLLLGAAEALLPTPAALTAVQVCVALTTTILIWRRAPFPDWLKLLILAGYYLLFEYGVIARSYGLGALLLFAWLVARRTPWGWLILALMANVAVHFALVSAVCVAANVWLERRWSWLGIGLWGIGCIAAVATVIPAHDLQTGSDVAHQLLSVRAIDALRRGSALLVPAQVWRWPYLWQVLLTNPVGPIVGAAAGVLTVLAPSRDPRASLLAFGLFLALFAMSTLLYPTYPRHLGGLVVMVIALEWIRLERRDASAPQAPRPRLSRAFIGWMGVSAVCGLWAAGWALMVPFSPGRQEARWIADHHLQNADWAAYHGYVGSDISAYFGRPTYSLQKECLNTFIRWDAHAYDDIDDDVLAQLIGDPGPFRYLASDQDLSRLHAPIRLLARFDHGLGDMDVFLYAVERDPDGVAAPCPAA